MPVFLCQSYWCTERKRWPYFLAMGTSKVGHIFVVKLNGAYRRQRMTTVTFALCTIRLVKLTLDWCGYLTRDFLTFGRRLPFAWWPQRMLQNQWRSCSWAIVNRLSNRSKTFSSNKNILSNLTFFFSPILFFHRLLERSRMVAKTRRKKFFFFRLIKDISFTLFKNLLADTFFLLIFFCSNSSETVFRVFQSKTYVFSPPSPSLRLPHPRGFSNSNFTSFSYILAVITFSCKAIIRVRV